MRGLLGDRFLKRFAGDLKHHLKQIASTGEGQNQAAEVNAAPGQKSFWPEVGRSDNHASEEDCEEVAADTAVINATVANLMVTDANDVPNEAEPNKHNETRPKGENPISGTSVNRTQSC